MQTHRQLTISQLKNLYQFLTNMEQHSYNTEQQYKQTSTNTISKQYEQSLQYQLNSRNVLIQQLVNISKFVVDGMIHVMEDVGEANKRVEEQMRRAESLVREIEHVKGLWDQAMQQNVWLKDQINLLTTQKQQAQTTHQHTLFTHITQNKLLQSQIQKLHEYIKHIQKQSKDTIERNEYLQKNIQSLLQTTNNLSSELSVLKSVQTSTFIHENGNGFCLDKNDKEDDCVNKGSCGVGGDNGKEGDGREVGERYQEGEKDGVGMGVSLKEEIQDQVYQYGHMQENSRDCIRQVDQQRADAKDYSYVCRSFSYADEDGHENMISPQLRQKQVKNSQHRQVLEQKKTYEILIQSRQDKPIMPLSLQNILIPSIVPLQVPKKLELEIPSTPKNSFSAQQSASPSALPTPKSMGSSGTKMSRIKYLMSTIGVESSNSKSNATTKKGQFTKRQKTEALDLSQERQKQRLKLTVKKVGSGSTACTLSSHPTTKRLITQYI